MITKRITISFGAPIINRRNVAMVLDKSDAWRNHFVILSNQKLSFTLKPSAIAKPAPCNINTPQGNVFDKWFQGKIGWYFQLSTNTKYDTFNQMH